MVTGGHQAWIAPRKAADWLLVSEMMIYKYSLLGMLRSQVLPGQNVRFSREDVQRIARERGIPDPVPVVPKKRGPKPKKRSKVAKA